MKNLEAGRLENGALSMVSLFSLIFFIFSTDVPPPYGIKCLQRYFKTDLGTFKE